MREWLVTNGLGGYASLTHSNENTRKYHGLLIASLTPPLNRWVFTSNIIENVELNDDIYPLTGGEFSFDKLPVFTYKLQGINIYKTIFMPHQENTTIIRYKIETKQPITITHRILLASRHIYDVSSSKRSFYVHQRNNGDNVEIEFSNTNRVLKILLPDSSYVEEETWIPMEYSTDKKRGDSWLDYNVYSGCFHKKIPESTIYHLILTIEDKRYEDAERYYLNELNRRGELIKDSGLVEKQYKLVLAADGFIVRRDSKKTVIAGYHWFSDWGRDTLISLPGLTLVTNRYNVAREILEGLVERIQGGLIPNTFNDKDNTPLYNTVDASLWYIDRVFQYLKYTMDTVFLKQVWSKLESIIASYINGTHHGIHMDNDGLITHDPGLTWMDVCIDGEYPTPRAGKAVEIQALWFNALSVMDRLSRLVNRENSNYIELAEKVKKSFLKQYDQQYDVIDTRDASCRPNKLLLVSLDFSMIDKELQREIILDVKRNLLTIFGLRTLSPLDNRYKGVYIDDNYHRDLAYHNGIVWPWLMGFFIKAFLKIYEYKTEWREYAYEEFLNPMLKVFGKKWDGFIPEIFDGEPPYTPRGCIAQAWSTAEILRSWVEDIMFKRPPYEEVLLGEEVTSY